jgi:hypothetical protein
LSTENDRDVSPDLASPATPKPIPFRREGAKLRSDPHAACGLAGRLETRRGARAGTSMAITRSSFRVHQPGRIAARVLRARNRIDLASRFAQELMKNPESQRIARQEGTVTRKHRL